MCVEHAEMDASAWSNTLQRTIEISGEVYEKTYQRPAGIMTYAQQVVHMVKEQHSLLVELPSKT